MRNNKRHQARPNASGSIRQDVKTAREPVKCIVLLSFWEEFMVDLTPTEAAAVSVVYTIPVEFGSTRD